MTFLSCAACQAKDAEIARAYEREKSLMQELRSLTNKFSAHADARAHEAAVRADRVPQGGAISRAARPKVSGRTPAQAASLALSGHLRESGGMEAWRNRDKPKVQAPGVAVKE